MATPTDVSDPAQPVNPTYGYGPREATDDTRQAQQQVANDAPVDVNPNAILAREQAATLVLMGKNFEAASSRRGNIADHLMGILMAKVKAE